MAPKADQSTAGSRREGDAPIAESWCRTNVHVVKSTFSWTIDNFSFCLESAGYQLYSSRFPEQPNGKFEWCLCLQTGGMNADDKDFLSLYLQLVASKIGGVRAKMKLSILDANLQQAHAKSSPVRRFDVGKPWGCYTFVRRDVLLADANNLLRGDQLAIYCEVDAVVEHATSHGHKSKMALEVPEYQLAADMGHLLESQVFSDVLLAVDGLEFRSHKAVLAARCPVFAAMFWHDMEENTKNRVEIIDVAQDVFQEFLCFIYTDRAPNLEKFAETLLVVADKYAVAKLKRMCEERLCSDLSTNTAAERLAFADMHNARQLKSHAIDFISVNILSVMETEGWKRVSQKQPHLIVEVFQNMARQQISCDYPPRKRIRTT